VEKRLPPNIHTTLCEKAIRERNQRGHVFNASSNVYSHLQTIFPFIDELAHSMKLSLILVSHILNKIYNIFQLNETRL
jgi:hypothetical protein